MRLSRCMSTQHPDNVTVPFFTDNAVLQGDAEIKEAFYMYSLGCREQMWDCEGKEVDTFVVKKLITRYSDFFSKTVLGRDVFLTLRIPNPTVEKDEAKILLESLESIPRSFDAARLCGSDVPPIFEVILPMTSNHHELNRIYYYYKKVVIDKEKLIPYDISVGEWVGGFKPEEINVIPLLENKESILSSDQIVGNYVSDKKIEYQRVFLARSDPALNYGMASAMLLVSIALQKLHELEERLSIDILPILGMGSSPFRGGFTPYTVANTLNEYPSVQTYTIQSAFKYDYPQKDVISAIGLLNSTKRGKPHSIDEKRSMEIIEKLSSAYIKDIQKLSCYVNEISVHIPKRRKRKLHIGLFGYSRSVGSIHLPRAIEFCASLYSIGIPPEILGLSGLDDRDIEFLIENTKFSKDVEASLRYLNVNNVKMFGLNIEKLSNFFTIDADEEHSHITDRIVKDFKAKNALEVAENVIKAAHIRRFLG